MSSPESEDEYDYEDYGLEFYEELEGPPLIKKKSRLIAAVVQNEVGILQDLLDSPQWFNVKDSLGYSLLQIAILCNNKKVFNYMISIPNFPLEFENKYGQTALGISLDGFVSNDIWMSEHFAYELIKKGAYLDIICFEDNTPLFRAIDRNYNRVTKLLIEKGVDLNIQNNKGETPVELALFSSNDWSEIIPALVMSGAEVSVKQFRDSILRKSPSHVQQLLFWYIFDELSEVEIHLSDLLQIAKGNQELFQEIMKLQIRVCGSSYCFFELCSMDTEDLIMVLEKFSQYFIQAFQTSNLTSWNVDERCRPIKITSLNVMLENENLRSGIIDCINNLNTRFAFRFLMFDSKYSEEDVTHLYCFLLSYGLNIREFDLYLVYEKFGYCELFKLLLHMDILKDAPQNYTTSILPVFIYDSTMNLDCLLQNSQNYRNYKIDELFSYFVHNGLSELCGEEMYLDIKNRNNLPDVPLLVELARNVFRKYFVCKFRISSCKDFYTLLNVLPISNLCRRIISYEEKLY